MDPDLKPQPPAQYFLSVASPNSVPMGRVLDIEQPTQLAIVGEVTVVGLILIGLLIAVSVFIEFVKDNKVQGWLERCVWGKGPGQRYSTVEMSMRELELALQGKSMEYTGLVRKYPIDRPLSDDEMARQLQQKSHLNVVSAYQLSVIRMRGIGENALVRLLKWKNV